MKSLKLLLSLLVFVVTLVSCGSMEKKHVTDRLKSFIPGTYIRAFEGEYSTGNDTLIIEQPGRNNNYYTIQHNSSYRQMKDGKLLPIEYKTENWTAIFNERTNVLEEQTKGKRLSFLPDENALLLGGNKFRKIE